MTMVEKHELHGILSVGGWLRLHRRVVKIRDLEAAYRFRYSRDELRAVLRRLEEIGLAEQPRTGLWRATADPR